MIVRLEITENVAAQIPISRGITVSKKSITFKFLMLCVVLSGLVAGVTGCGDTARLPVSSGFGPHPELPQPTRSLIPTINVVTATGWAADEKPVAAEGMEVTAFARALEHPRWLYVLPNGDVLVAETNAPTRPEDSKGIKGWFFKHYQKKAGGAAPSANRITLLRDADGDGIAETRSVFLAGLSSPFGMVLVGNTFYVANTDALVRFPYSEGQTEITAGATKIVDLPAGPINHHWTKNLVANSDGSKLYVAVGSNSNILENGIEQEAGPARRSGRWILKQEAIASLLPVCGTPWEWPGSRRPVRCG
jgi:glucose/arabinose dehydrogenase